MKKARRESLQRAEKKKATLDEHRRRGQVSIDLSQLKEAQLCLSIANELVALGVRA